jgi:hypothetical protein
VCVVYAPNLHKRVYTIICMRAIVRTFVSVGARALGEEQSRSGSTREARAPEVAAPRRHSSLSLSHSQLTAFPLQALAARRVGGRIIYHRERPALRDLGGPVLGAKIRM